MSKTPLEEVKEKIKDIENKRISDKLEVQGAIAKARADEAEAHKALADAAAMLDAAAYNDAADKEYKAHMLVKMHEEKARQMQEQEDISEEESDKVIDGLLEYSKRLDANFTAAIKEKAEELRKLQDAYTAEAQDVERTINYWCDHIHANYNTRGRTTYSVNGKRSHRSPEPVPVIMRRGPWTGCHASNALNDFLSRLDDKGFLLDSLSGAGQY